MKNVRGSIIFFLCASLVMGVFAGCGSSNNASSSNETASAQTSESVSSEAASEVALEASSAPIEKVELKMSHHPYVHALPGIYADETGMYEDYFDYTIDLYSNGPVQNEAIASGAWEVGTTGLGGAVLGIINYDMKVLGFTTPDTNTTDIWVRPDSPLATAKVGDNGVVGTAEDWKGLTVLCNRGTICHMALLGTLDYLGITESDIDIIDASVANCYTAFLAGEADVVCLWDALGSKAVENGWVKVSSAKDLGIDLPAVIVATDAAVKEKPEAIKTWLSIYLDASDILAQNPEDAAKRLYEFQTSEGIAVTEEDSKVTVVERPFLTLDEQVTMFTPEADGKSRAYEALMKYAEFMLSQGNIKQKDYDRMANSDFIISDYVLEIAESKK